MIIMKKQTEIYEYYIWEDKEKCISFQESLNMDYASQKDLRQSFHSGRIIYTNLLGNTHF